MKSKHQILYVHGGHTLRNQKEYLHLLKTRKISIKKKPAWSSSYLDERLGGKFEIIRPRMPLQDHAKYVDWKIHFERYFPFLRRNLILVGESLGGIFLAKYLSENKFPKKILSAILICPPFDDTLPTESLAGGFKLKRDLSLIERNCKNLRLLFSKDDNVVPPSHAKKYGDKLEKAKIIIYKSKNGHFQLSRFPEIVEMIKKDVKRA